MIRSHLRRHPLHGATIGFVLALGTPSRGDGQDPDRAPSIPLDTVGVEVVTSDPRNSTAYCTLTEEPTISLGTTEGDDPYMFYFVRGANRLSDGSIAMMDNGSGEIRIFSPDGRHLRSMGGQGEGPGEFRIGRYIWVLPGDTLWVGDYRPWRYHVYLSTGEFIRTVEMNPRYLNASLGGGVLDNGTSVNVRDLFRREYDFEVPEFRFAEAHSPDGTVVGELARLEATREGSWEGAAVNMSTLFDPIPSVHARGNTIAIATAREPEVLLLDDDLRVRRIVRWSDPDRRVTRAHVRAYRERRIERRGGRDSEDWRQSDDDAISDRRPVADVFPTVSDVQVGREGRLWVYPYAKPGENVDWWAFAPDGEFLCRLANPNGLTIHEFGPDYLLGVHTDELGVERVVMYELRLPASPGGADAG